MTGGIVVLFPLVVGVLAVIAVLALVPRRRRQVAIDENTDPGLAALRAKTTLARVIGIPVAIGAGMATASLSAPWTSLGRGVLLAPLVAGIVLVAAVALGDVAAHRNARSQAGGPRTAASASEHRRLRDVIPPPLAAGVGVCALVLPVLLAVGWATGSPDDLGRPGRSFATTSPDGIYTSASSPWPGRFYGVVAVPAVIVLLLALIGALVAVARRPRDGSDPEFSRVDGIVRRREAESLIAAAGLALSLTVAGLGLFMAPILFRVRRGAALNGYEMPLGYDLAGWGMLAITVGAVVLGVWCAVALLVPGPAASHGPRAARATAQPEAIG